MLEDAVAPPPLSLVKGTIRASQQRIQVGSLACSRATPTLMVTCTGPPPVVTGVHPTAIRIRSACRTASSQCVKKTNSSPP